MFKPNNFFALSAIIICLAAFVFVINGEGGDSKKSAEKPIVRIKGGLSEMGLGKIKVDNHMGKIKWKLGEVKILSEFQKKLYKQQDQINHLHQQVKSLYWSRNMFIWAWVASMLLIMLLFYKVQKLE